MKNSNDIDDIRLLLEKYYEAETSGEEEKELLTFFRETDIAAISEDMRTDMKLLSLMESLRPQPSEYAVPDNLEYKINAIVYHRSITLSGRKRQLQRFIKFSGIAAAAMLIWAIVYFTPNFMNNKTDMPEAPEVAALTDYGDITTLSSAESNPQSNDGFIELNDVEEVRAMVLEINGLLSRNADMTSIAISQITNTLNKYKEIYKSIL